MKGKNQKDLKEENTSTVLRLVRDNPQISRIDVVRLTNLAPPTVSRIIAFLINSNVISEMRGNSKSVGRKPFYLTFEGTNFKVLSVEISYTYVRFAVIDLNGKIHKTSEIKTSTSINNKELKALISKNAEEYLSKYEDIFAFGISSPGRVDPKNTLIISVPNLKNIKNFSFDTISSTFGKPVFVSNDANAEALAEMYFGMGKDVDDFLLLHIGFGIGGGVVLNKKLYAGNFGVSGEIGHISVDKDFGLECDCGNRGCVELYANLNKILNEIGKATNRTNLTIEEAYEILKNENDIALKVVHEKGEIIGNMLVSVVNLVSPKRIIISGPITTIANFIIPSIKITLNERSFYGFGKNIEIISSKLKENAGLIGAMSIVLEEFLEHPYEFIDQKEN